jgi:hypothetical protein
VLLYITTKCEELFSPTSKSSSFFKCEELFSPTSKSSSFFVNLPAQSEFSNEIVMSEDSAIDKRAPDCSTIGRELDPTDLQRKGVSLCTSRSTKAGYIRTTVKILGNAV